MALAIVRSQKTSGIAGSSIPGVVTMGGAPATGNLLIAFLCVNVANVGDVTIDTTKWTQFDRAIEYDDNNIICLGLYRYAPPGSTAALPAFATTGGSTYWAATTYEISGVSGTWANDYHASDNVWSLVNGTTVFGKTRSGPAGCLALAGLAAYNATANPSMSAGWTRDQTGFDAANFGAYCCGSQAIASAEQDITLTFTSSNISDPHGGILLILRPSVPTTPHVQRRRTMQASAVPGTINFGGKPTVGNVLVAILHWESGNQDEPTIGANWTKFLTVTGAATKEALLGYYRYVQSGDTMALPALATSGSAFFALSVWEIECVNASWSSALVSVKSGYTNPAGSSRTTTADATTANDQLALLSAANYNGTGTGATGPTGWQVIRTEATATYGQHWEAYQKPASGSSIQATLTPSFTTDAFSYAQLIFTNASATPAGDAVSILGGIVQEAKTGNLSDAVSVLGGIVQAATGGVLQATISQVLGGIAEFAEAEQSEQSRTTQLPRLLLSELPRDARTTQLARLVIETLPVDLQTTQLARLVIADGVNCVTKWTQLWKIKRRDGEVFRYTALDVDFLWGEELYKSCGSLNPSAAEEASAIGQVSNQELQGVFSDDGITEAALYGGLFDDAFVQVWLVAYEGTESPRRLAAGWTGNLSHGEKGFNMEVVGPGARLDQQAIVQTFTPQCRWVFGDSRCQYDREAAKLSGIVTGVTNRGRFTAEIETASADPDALQWQNGKVRWTYGDNDSLECEVKTATFEAGSGLTVDVELWELAGFEPQLGDSFDILPGCDLTAPTCKGVYNNLINFGGFPDVPGQDDVVKTPDAKLS